MTGLPGFLLVVSVAFASGTSNAQAQTLDAAQVAAQQADIDLAVAPLRSMADVRHHLRTTPDSPLHALRPAARAQFIKSLVFTPEGLGSHAHGTLTDALSVTDVYRVLALFGAQSSIGDIPGLASPANLVEARMIEASLLAPMAAMPPWMHGVCVVNGPQRRCIRSMGSYCSRACDR